MCLHTWHSPAFHFRAGFDLGLKRDTQWVKWMYMELITGPMRNAGGVRKNKQSSSKDMKKALKILSRLGLILIIEVTTKICQF